MTKPITSVAAMMLFEEGEFDLTDPISRWLPEFARPSVYTKGSSLRPVTGPATEPIRVWHLLTHTAGLTYGFHHAHPVDALYRERGFEWGTPTGLDLAACSEAWADLPLVHQPGAEWNYSVATDVLGRLVEVVSGMPLDRFFAERIFSPLGMTQTGFQVEGDALERLAALYVPRPGTREAVRNDAFGAAITKPPDCLSGGGGLASTAADYHRFAQFLLRGGELDGVRLLGPGTVALMGRNHLPDGADLAAFGRPLFAEMPRSTGSDSASASRFCRTRSRPGLSPPKGNWPGAARRVRRSGWIRHGRSPCCSSPSCCRPAPTRCGSSCVNSSTRH